MTEIQLYEAKPPREMVSFKEGTHVDGICFTSTSTVVNFCKKQRGYRNTKVFVIGEITARTAADNGFTDVTVSDEATIESLILKISEVFTT